jgi:hypothetical protein
MDEGPFRASRPADRRTVSRSEPAYRQPEEPQQPRQESQSADRAPLSQRTTRDKKPSKRFKFPLLLAIILLAAIIGGLAWANLNNKNAGTAIDTSKYQAVFFTNGQVYFGKLSTLNDEYLKLTDIYYLQTQAAEGKESNPQTTSNDQSDVQLIKLGEEIHGPEDEMVLSKDQLLFYENLKVDGKVAQSIEAYKKAH